MHFNRMSDEYRQYEPPSNIKSQQTAPASLATARKMKKESVQPSSRSSPDVQAQGGQQGASWATWKAGSTPSQLRPVSLKSGESVYVSFSESPSKFWCQPSLGVDQLATVATSITEEYSNLGAGALMLRSPSAGGLCCALYSEDECWYRAQIIQVQSNSAQVYFIDYGNTETVALASLRQLKEEYTDLPSQAVQCSLANISAKGNSWSPAAITEFTQLTEEKELRVEIAGNSGNVYQVELFDPPTKKFVSTMLINGGFGVKATDSVGNRRQSIESTSSGQTTGLAVPKYQLATMSVGDLTDVNVVHVVNPLDFYCQLTQNSAQLEALMEGLATDYTKVKHILAVVSYPAYETAVDLWSNTTALEYPFTHSSYLFIKSFKNVMNKGGLFLVLPLGRTPTGGLAGFLDCSDLN